MKDALTAPIASGRSGYQQGRPFPPPSTGPTPQVVSPDNAHVRVHIRIVPAGRLRRAGRRSSWSLHYRSVPAVLGQPLQGVTHEPLG